LINNSAFSSYGENFITIDDKHNISFIGQKLQIDDLEISDKQILCPTSEKICFNGNGIAFTGNLENCSFEVSNSRITNKVSATFY
jgi:hypothetical protein